MAIRSLWGQETDKVFYLFFYICKMCSELCYLLCQRKEVTRRHHGWRPGKQFLKSGDHTSSENALMYFNMVFGHRLPSVTFFAVNLSSLTRKIVFLSEKHTQNTIVLIARPQSQT